MRIMPSKFDARITYCESHTPVWTTHAGDIGTTPADVQDVEIKTAAARAAMIRQKSAQDAAQSATAELRRTVADMTVAAGDVIKQIRLKAAKDGDRVYELADIPAPARPSLRPPPGRPFDLIVKLDGNGNLDLSWKCKNPRGTAGTMYTVYRRLRAGEHFTFLGGSGERKITDSTIPQGVTAVTYQIQAVRSTSVGYHAEFSVNFGTNQPGVTVQPVVTPLAA